MQLAAFRAEHFRSLYDSGWIPFHDLTILIGENDGGKTATLDALEMLLGNRVPDPEDFSFCLGSAPDDEGKIPHEEQIVLEGRFSVADEERSEVQKYAPLSSGHLHIRKRFAKDVQLKFHIIGPVSVDQRLNVDLDAMKIQDMRTLTSNLGLQISGTAKQPFIEALRDYRANQPTTEGEVPFPFAIRHLLSEFNRFDSASDPQSVVHSVLRLIFREELEKPENAKHLRDVEKNITARLREQAEALNPFVRKYRPEVKAVSVDPEFNFETGFKATKLRLEDTYGRPILFEKRGAGIRRHITLAVYEWNSEVIKKRQEQGARPVILGLDEPDTSLDYNSQRQLFDIIQGFVGPLVQVVICTHSINLINRVPVDRLNHYSLDKDGVKSIVESFIPDPEDHEQVDFFLHRLGDTIGLHNALMFYERCFLLFEGKTEDTALPIIFKLCTGEFPYTKGIRIINAYDNYGAIVFAKFLHQHRRNVVFAVDEDTTRNKGVKRHLTKEALERAGFNIRDQVHFICPDHFEFSFSNAVWARALSDFAGSPEWTPDKVQSLRQPPQGFSDKLMRESGIQSKPQLGLVLAKSLRDPADVPECIRDCIKRAVEMAL